MIDKTDGNLTRHTQPFFCLIYEKKNDWPWSIWLIVNWKTVGKDARGCPIVFHLVHTGTHSLSLMPNFPSNRPCTVPVTPPQIFDTCGWFNHFCAAFMRFLDYYYFEYGGEGSNPESIDVCLCVICYGYFVNSYV